jgi:Tannase and feruloyl esterase
MISSCAAHRAAAPHGPFRQSLRFLAVSGLWVLLLTLPAFSQGAAPAVSCESLANLAPPDTTITMAKLVGAGEFQMPQSGMRGPGGPGGPGGAGGTDRMGGGPGGQGGPGGRGGPGGPGGNVDVKTLPAFCRIAATVKPSSDSNIRIEVWLPTTTWNGKFLGLGNGGMAGSIVYAGGMALGLTDALRLGYAAGNTDAGHDSSAESADGNFLLGHPEKQIDFGYRANHEMTVKAKALIKAFYGVAPKHSYFIVCSLGSQEAMSEAKRFPEDYDGIMAGAAMNQIAQFNAAQLWPTVLIARTRPSAFRTRSSV